MPATGLQIASRLKRLRAAGYKEQNASTHRPPPLSYFRRCFNQPDLDRLAVSTANA